MAFEGSRPTLHSVDHLGDGRFSPPSEEDAWPNSNVVGAPEGERYSRAPADDDNPAEGGRRDSQNTLDLLRDITYVGGMCYARQEIEKTARPCAYGMQKNQTPMLNVTNEMGAGDMPRARSEAGSVASSRRSFRTVAEAAIVRTAILVAATEAQRAPTPRALSAMSDIR